MSYKLITSGEAPTYGEELESGELFLDGTDSFVSSENRKPVVDNVDFTPAIETIDGIDYEPDELKFSGKGTYGFFGDYTNVATLPFSSPTNVTESKEGCWTKLTTVADGESRVQFNFTALASTGYYSIYLRRGNTATSKVYANGTLMIDWGLKTFTFGTGITDAGCRFISDEIAECRIYNTATGGTRFYLFGGDGATSLAGDYTYYKDWQVVDLDYPVPYTPGVHTRNKLQYNIDWATSDEWTIEGWFKFNSVTAFQQFIVSPRDASSSDYWVFRSGTTNTLEIITNDGAATITALTGYVADSWNHFKIVYTSATSLNVYINGGTVQTITANVPSSSDMVKSVYIGSYSDWLSPLAGYIQDIRITPTSDTSTDHYTADLPYYNPDKTYGKNALWSIDDKGHFSGQFDNAGRIVEEYELDGQHVTKWDTGLKMIRMVITTTSGGTKNITFVESFVSNSYSMSGMISSTASKNITYSSSLAGSVTINNWNSSGVAYNSAGWYTFIGRWK